MTVRDDVNQIMRALGLRSRAVRTLIDLPEADAEVFRELEARVQAGTATDADRSEYNRLKASLATGQRVRTRPLGPAAPPASEATTDLEERLAGWGVPTLYLTSYPRLQDALTGRDKLIRTPAMVAVEPLRTGAHILVLIGDRGCGKSYAAAWWLAKVAASTPPALRKRVQPRRFIEMDLLPDVDAGDRLDLAYATALVIDDAGTERDTWIEAVATLIARRHRHALPTVITTNLNRKELERRYGARVADRLRESGEYRMVGDVGSSLRGKR